MVKLKEGVKEEAHWTQPSATLVIRLEQDHQKTVCLEIDYSCNTKLLNDTDFQERQKDRKIKSALLFVAILCAYNSEVTKPKPSYEVLPNFRPELDSVFKDEETCFGHTENFSPSTDQMNSSLNLTVQTEPLACTW